MVTAMRTFSADSYRRALVFAAGAHANQQLLDSNLPYLVHLTSVAAEVLAMATLPSEGDWDVDLAVACALLHDTLEDTETTEAQLQASFGERVTRGVRALTKDRDLPRGQKMGDSLHRIVAEPREIAMVKLADRICNLQRPPAHWTRAKRAEYREEAREILRALGHASEALRARLASKIEAYDAYVQDGT